MNKITKIEYSQAGINSFKINGAIPALANITDEMIGSEPGTVAAFCDLLQSALNDAQSVLARGQIQYENRDDKFISKLLNHQMAIPGQIELLEKNLKNKIECRSSKVDELTKQGFSPDEIDKICPSVSDEDIAMIEKQKSDLRADAEAIKAFINDAPEFRLTLLPKHLAELAN